MSAADRQACAENSHSPCGRAHFDAVDRTRCAVSVRFLATCVCLLMLPGCVYHGDYSIKRIWFDHNTLSAPALFVEKADHFPYHKARVGHFRWMYNAGPGRPFPGEITSAAGIETTIPVSTFGATPGTGLLLPPVPSPAEPKTTTKMPSKPLQRELKTEGGMSAMRKQPSGKNKASAPKSGEPKPAQSAKPSSKSPPSKKRPRINGPTAWKTGWSKLQTFFRRKERSTDPPEAAKSLRAKRQQTVERDANSGKRG